MYLLVSTVVEFQVKLAHFVLVLHVHLMKLMQKHTVQHLRKLDSFHAMLV